MEKVLSFLNNEKIIKPIFIIVVSIIFLKLAKSILHRIFIKDKQGFRVKKGATILQLAENVTKFFIFAIAIVMILNVYGVDTNGIIASLGIAGAVIGLAFQNTVQDIMAGISIIMDNFYVVGDYIKLDDFLGEVVEISLKSTKVKNFEGMTLIFANRNVNKVINLSQSSPSVKIDIPTAYEEKAEKVESVIKEILEEVNKLDGVIASSYLGIDSLNDSSINYSILIQCRGKDQYVIRRKALRIIKETYDNNNIKIPYNQIEVHNGK